MTKTFAYYSFSALATIALASAAVIGGGPVAMAGPVPGSEKVCTITYPTPDDFNVEASSDAYAVPHGDGTLDLILVTDSHSDVGYEQHFTVTWANIDTSRNGQADVTAQVRGSSTTLVVPGVATKPGKVAFVLGAHNHGSAQNYTNGDCSVTYTVR
ncbi:hypothetical protein D5S18_17465 [Nocardia panacis]|uniref:DUF4402 domain-containing protein n=1 Tax=Nocardia panacis TaxID=2340916 RepID=A0A3A4KAT6_9NOCA|nr:hypothetical protein D5S18_17465 [Nocardia panacis]